MEAVVLRPGEGETITAEAARAVVIKADHELLDLTEARYADAFYVLEGDADARYLNVHSPRLDFAESLRVRRDGGDYEAEQFDQFDAPSDGGRSVADAVVRGPAVMAELASRYGFAPV